MLNLISAVLDVVRDSRIFQVVVALAEFEYKSQILCFDVLDVALW